jgi:ATP synthase protein I
MSQKSENHDHLDNAVKLREERRQRWQREGERSVGQNLAMIGILGWSIVVPTLLGVLAGRALDRYFGAGVVFTCCLLVAGLVLGCALAWRRITSE